MTESEELTFIMPMETIALACDHGGLELKTALQDDLIKAGYDVLDLGTNSPASVDYPDYAQAMAAALADGRAGRGLLVCGTGIGISIAANRFDHVRAALVHDAFTARMCRQHNDANVLVLGGRTTGIETARDCLKVFLETPFEGGRHASRLAKFGRPL